VDDENDTKVVYHSNSVPTLFPFHFTILKGYLKRIVENDNRSLEVDAMLSRVGPVLSCVPDEFHGNAWLIMYIQ
jgi:hypothetical protein